MKDIDAVIVASPLHITHGIFWIRLQPARTSIRENNDLVHSGGRGMPRDSEESDRVVQIGLQHESSGSLADAGKWIKEECWEGYPSGVVDESQHPPRQRSVGAQGTPDCTAKMLIGKLS